MSFTIESAPASLIQKSPLIARVWNVLNGFRDQVTSTTRGLYLEVLVLHVELMLLGVVETDAFLGALERRMVDRASDRARHELGSIFDSLWAFGGGRYWRRWVRCRHC